MFLKRITLALAILLTMFAVNAKAITCTPAPPECAPGSLTGSGTIEMQLIGIGGTYVCKFDYCYCYLCPSAPDTVIKLKVWSIVSLDACPDVNLALVYDKIREDITSGNHIMNICGPMPPCLPLPSHYKYLEYSTSACWHGTTIGGIVYFLPCPNCTAQCLWNYRYCFDPGGSIFLELVSNTLIGSLDCGQGCHNNGFGPNDYEPVFGECYHVCE